MTNGEKHIEKLLSWYKEAVTEDGVCYLTSDDKNTLTYAIKCCKQNDLGVDCISREEAIDIIKCLAWHTRPDEDDIEQAIKVLEQESSNSGKPNDSTTKNDLGVDWDELKRKILMEVDGGTDDKWLTYGDVCDRISKSIDEYIADMREVEE